MRSHPSFHGFMNWETTLGLRNADLGITLLLRLPVVAVRLALLDSTTCAANHLALSFKLTIKYVLAAGACSRRHRR